jgi:amidophosphoribosyltransferase
MCGIAGILDISNDIVNMLYRSVFYLQHRGQHSSGFIFFSTQSKKTFKSKQIGLIDKHLNELLHFSGNMGLSHVRYPTSGNSERSEIQPFSILKPFGISLVHNGNIRNSEKLKEFLNIHNVYINGTSDSELILNIFYFFIEKDFSKLTNDKIIEAIYKIYELCNGSFSVIIMISDYGLIAFRDKYGIRPLAYSIDKTTVKFASETIAFDNNKFHDVGNGEVIIVTKNLEKQSYKLFNEKLTPCIFEYIYFATAESYINNVLVYNFREKVGEEIIKLIEPEIRDIIDIIVPVPLTSIISSTVISNKLQKPLKHAIVKNRYTHRSFINSGNNITNTIEKIKIIPELVENKNILIVDDSIVRGNTCKHIIKELRKTKIKKIFFASCSPQVKYPNKYGIHIPTSSELIAHNNSIKEIEQLLNIDKLYYLSIQHIKNILYNLNPNINSIEDSSFTGNYIN